MVAAEAEVDAESRTHTPLALLRQARPLWEEDESNGSQPGFVVKACRCMRWSAPLLVAPVFFDCLFRGLACMLLYLAWKW